MSVTVTAVVQEATADVDAVSVDVSLPGPQGAAGVIFNVDGGHPGSVYAPGYHVDGGHA